MAVFSADSPHSSPNTRGGNIICATTVGSSRHTPAAGEKRKANPVPEWLSSFGRKATTIAAVNSATDRLDRIEKKEPAPKERRIGEESECATDGGSACDVEKMKQFRYEACNLLRGTYADILNRGRTDVRAHLFEEFLFLTEHISKFESVQIAKGMPGIL